MPPKTIPVSPTGLNPNPQSESVLGRIRPVEATNFSRLKFSVYGDPGTGKTRFACTFPKPILLIATEIGTDSVVGTPGIDVAPTGPPTDLWSLYDHAVTGRSQWGLAKSPSGETLQYLGPGQFRGERYKTVVLDSATKLRKDMIRELFRSQGKEVPRSQPFLYAGKEWKDVWQQCSHEMQKYLGAFLNLPNQAELSVVVTSHEANLTHDDGSSPAMSEFLKPNVSSAIGKAVADFVNAEVSYMGQMLIRDRYDTFTKKVTETISTEERIKVGTEFVMRVGPDAVYRTKFRRPLTVTRPLPDFVVDPTYDKIVQVIKGEL